MPDSRPVKLTFTAEVAQALKAMGHLEVSAEDLEQAFVEASNSSQDLERKIQRATREAEKDVEKLERAVRELPDATDDAADQADRDFRRIGDSAKDTGRETGQSFRQSLGEGLSSGGANLSDTIGETLGEAVAEAPLPVAAIGTLVLAVWGIMKAESAKQKQELKDLFDITDLMTGAIEKKALLEETLTDIGGGDLQTGLDKTKELAKTLGLSIGDVTAMLTGETNPAVNDMVRHLEESNTELNKNWITTGSISDENRKLIEAGETILHQHRQQKEELGVVAEQASTWEAGMKGVESASKGVLLTEQQIAALKDDQVRSTELIAIQTANIKKNLEEMPKDINVRINTQLAGNVGQQQLGSMMGSGSASTAKYG